MSAEGRVNFKFGSITGGGVHLTFGISVGGAFPDAEPDDPPTWSSGKMSLWAGLLCNPV